VRPFALVLALLLLTACATSDEGEVRFTVTRIDPPYESMGTMQPEYVAMDLGGDVPEGTLGLSKKEGAAKSQFPADIKVGDSVVCTVRKHDDNNLDDVDPITTIGPCRKV
jgi:uncharacterized OB-fold protein